MGGLMGDNTTKKKTKDATPQSHQMEIKEASVDQEVPSVYELQLVFKKTAIPLFINIALCVICLIVMGISMEENQTEFRREWDIIMYMCAAGLNIIILLVILFTIIARRFAGLTKMIHIMFIVLCVIAIILLAVGSIGAAANVERDDDCQNMYGPCWWEWYGDIAAGAAGVGFLTIISLLVQMIFHIRDAKNNAYAAIAITNTWLE